MLFIYISKTYINIFSSVLFQCFLCKTRISFDILLEDMKTKVLTASTQPLFEITKTRSPEWVSSMPGIVPSTITSSTYHYYPSIITTTPTTNECKRQVQEQRSDSCNNSFDDFQITTSELNTSSSFQTLCTTTYPDDLTSYSSLRTISCGDSEGFC